MRGQRAQVGALLLLLLPMFGCKSGALAFAAITAVRVVAVAAAAATQGSHHSPNRETPVPAAAEAEKSEVPEEQQATAFEVPPSPNCTEVKVEIVPPPPPGSPPPPRAVSCDGKVLIQDSEGHWQLYDESNAAAVKVSP